MFISYAQVNAIGNLQFLIVILQNLFINDYKISGDFIVIVERDILNIKYGFFFKKLMIVSHMLGLLCNHIKKVLWLFSDEFHSGL